MVVALCAKNVVASTAKSGEAPSTSSVTIAARGPSSARAVNQTMTSVTSPSRGVTSQPAPARIPSASSAEVPGGYLLRTNWSMMT